jgi:hypothetical protein
MLADRCGSEDWIDDEYCGDAVEIGPWNEPLKLEALKLFDPVK